MDSTSSNPWDEFLGYIKSELEQSILTYQEVSQMIEQSQTELSKLTQRSASITSQIQKMQANFDAITKEEIRAAYSSSLDAQQRLLVMRGQIEKLQTDQVSLQRYISILDKTNEFLIEGPQPSRGTKGGRSGSELLEKLINAQEGERQRLSRQMHDGPAQALSNFIIQTEIAARFLEMEPTKAKEELDNLKTAAMSTFQKVRLFITDLRPMMLDDLGLVPTVRRYVDSFKDQTGVEAQIILKGSDRRLEPFIEVMLFRAIQELMGNAVRHNADAAVRPQVTVQLAIDDNIVRATVMDNGKGFNPDDIVHTKGLGLKLIRERVELLGGFMNIDSSPGQGARVTLQIPVESLNS
jgi:two-component system sensor histidine kinase DegS